MHVIDRKIFSLSIIVTLIYFVGVTTYSLPFDIFDIGNQIKKSFWWINETIYGIALPYVVYRMTLNKQMKVLMLGVIVFELILGIFQQLFTYNLVISSLPWCTVAPLYILFILILLKVCRQGSI